MQLKSNEGSTIRSADAPDVTANPRFKNWLWIKEGNPPSLQLFNVNTGLWVCDSCNPYAGTVLTQLDPPVFIPVDQSKTDGFSMTHVTAGAVIWYSINGSPFQPYGGGTILYGVPDYMFVAAYAVKSLFRDSETVLVEYKHG